MNENQIDTFLAIALHGSFSRAAQTLYISQPAVTYRIRSLEEELGVRLFDCGTFSAMLTPAGEAFFEEAKKLRDMFFESRSRMLDFSPESVVTLGFPEIMLKDGRAFLAIMDECNKAIGGSDGHLVRSRRLDKAPMHIQQLLRGEVDLIFADLGLEELRGERFEKRRLFNEIPRVWMHKSHPLAKKRSVRMEDLRGNKVYLYEDETSFTMRAREALMSRGIEPRMSCAPSLMELAPYLLRADGVTLTNQRPIEYGEMVCLALEDEMKNDVGIAWVKNRTTPRLRQAIHIIEGMPWESWLDQSSRLEKR